MRLTRRMVFLSAITSLVLLVIAPPFADGGWDRARRLFPQERSRPSHGRWGARELARDPSWRRQRRSCVAMTVVFAGLAFAAQSATSLIVIFAFCGASLFVALFRRNVAARLILIFVSAPILVVFVLSPDVILDLLGKDATLTGRTELWNLVDINISERPLLGWGFDAFWSQINPAANEISANLGWAVPQAHNGLRELLLEVGWVGTSLFALVFVRNIWIGMRCLRTPQRELGLSLLLCCGGILLVGVSEEVLVDPSQISVGMLFVMGLIGERILREEGAHPHRFRPLTPSLLSIPASGPDL